MGVRWQITFKSNNPDNDHTGLVKVYDSNYSGDPIILEPAVNPFYVSVKQSELITPVVSDSGYLRIIDNDNPSAHIDELHPSGAMDRPVEFYWDNTLQWRGYISPETYMVPWEPAPREVEFPLVGVLDVLDSVNITDNGNGLQTIAKFLDEILTATGMSFSYVIMPRQMIQIGPYNDVPELRIKLSRYNFLSLNDSTSQDDPEWTEMVGVTWKKVLEDICQYFGWTASAQGAYFVLTTPRTDITDYYQFLRFYLSSVDIHYQADIPYTAITRDTVTNLDWDGVNHRRSLTNGKKKITVRTNTPAPEGHISEILFNGEVEFDGEREYSYNLTPSGSTYKAEIHSFLKVLGIDKEHVTLHKYQVTDIGQSDEDYHEVTWDYPTDMLDMACPSAFIVRGFCWGWKSSDDGHGTTTDGQTEAPSQKMFINALRLGRNKDNTYYVFQEIVPLVTITSRTACAYPSGSALCINANVQTSFVNTELRVATLICDTSGASMWGANNRTLKCSLKIGTKWYDGTTWVESVSPVTFDIKCDTSSAANAVGKVGNSVTMEMPYSGANGFIIPIDQYLEGKMELTFFTYYTGSQSVNHTGPAAVYINELTITHYSGDEKNNELKLSRLTGKTYQDNMDLTLNLSSSKDHRISQSLLWFEGLPVGTVELLGYSGALTLSQPEYWLMDTLLMLYTNPSQELVLEVGFDSTLKVYDFVSLGGKTYVITGREIDYADEYVKLYIVSYE